MDKLYRLIFQGIDRVSNVTRGIDQSLNRTLGNTGAVGKGFDSMGSQVFDGAFKANLAMKGLDLAVQAVSATIGFFQKQLSSASDQQNSMTIAAINLSDVLGGISIDKAAGMIDNLDSVVAKATAPLPGTTKTYVDLANALTDKVIPAALDASGALNSDKFEQDSLKITRLFGVLGTSAGNSAGDIVSAAQKALAGSMTLGEMNQLDLFTRTPLKRTIEAELKVYGAKQLKDLTDQQRVELFTKISDRLLSGQALAKLSNTFSGKVEGIMTMLFDDMSGLFGFNKKLKARGNMKVIDGATSVLNEIMDIFDAIGKIMGGAGFNADSPGEFIYDRLQDLADFLDQIEKLLEDNAPIYTGLIQVADFVLTRIGDVFNIIFGTLFDVVKLIAAIVNFSRPTIGAVLDFLGKSINSLVLLLQSIGNMISGIATGDLSRIDKGWGQFGQSLVGSDRSVTRSPVVQTGLSNAINTVGVNIVGARYSGQIPQSVLDFSRTESAFSGGAKQVIANTNEYILRPDELKNLITNIQNSANQNFYITVQTMTEQQFADMIVNTVKSTWNETKLANT